MMLEIEMLDIPEASRQDMQSDLAQMNDIVGQFMDYAKLDAEVKAVSEVDLSGLLADILSPLKTQEV